MTREQRRNLWGLLAVALPLFGVDQITKQAIVARLYQGEVDPVLGKFFALCHWTNTGAAFSIGSGRNELFIGIAAVTLIFVVILFLKDYFPNRSSRVAVSLLISGILGNVTDRIIHGHVIDFLLFDLGFPPANPWPAFNVADMCICTAAGLLILGSFLAPEPAKQSTVASDKSDPTQPTSPTNPQ